MAQALAMYADELPSITNLVTVNGTPTYKVAEWFRSVVTTSRPLCADLGIIMSQIKYNYFRGEFGVKNGKWLQNELYFFTLHID
tara:strand:+ start:3463 stop:3714 length:252 start_codon:yes stop_codon:yes gene_type:complete